MNLRSMRGAEAARDHFMVRITLKNGMNELRETDKRQGNLYEGD